MQSAKYKVQLKTSVPTGVRLLLSGFALCTLHFAFFSCAKPIQERHGKNNDVMAESSGSAIEAVVGGGVPVATIRAAAEATLRARGYVITETYGTRDKVKIEASGTGENRTDTTTIEAWLAGNGTRVRVDSGMFGDVAPARAILDEILVRLGR